MSVRTIAFASFAALATLVVPAAAQAADYDGNSRTVSFTDLDLSSAAGAATLDRRIRSAAKQVCGAIDVRSLQNVTAVNSCRTAAIASAEPQVKLVLAARASGAAYADAGGITVAAY